MFSDLKIETVAVQELISRGVRPESGEHRVIVLVVDDDRVVADSLADLLQRSGFCATAAYRPEAALEFASVVPPDLLITSVSLPGMDGIELAMMMEKTCPDCRVLLLSADPCIEDRIEKSRQQGHCYPLLTKPTHPQQLLFALADPDGAPPGARKGNA